MTNSVSEKAEIIINDPFVDFKDILQLVDKFHRVEVKMKDGIFIWEDGESKNES